jgi:TM2 domain-containing membrane protein YozV
VLGIQALSQRYGPSRPRRKARIAALFAVLLPGLGAVYNRQNFKAVAHFLAVVGLFQLRQVFPLGAMFVLASIGFYFYSIIDAYRTAILIAEGESPRTNEERFKRRLISRAPAIGFVLVVAGVLLVIQIFQPFTSFISVARLLPVALIILGGYLLTSYFKRSRDGAAGPDYSQRPPYPLIPGSVGERDPQGTPSSRHGSRR